jgi:uncharacterized heparinase superfamily protein
MYHSIVLEDILDLINLGRAFPDCALAACDRDLAEVAGRMRQWLSAMRHPDGEIAFFNDAAFGIAPAPAALEYYAERLGLAPLAAPSSPLVHLAQSGYVRWEADGATILLDVGAIGPDYLPGHAHADTLSFEMSLNGRRVIVNGGTSTYRDCPKRHRERGTPAHSTVTVDASDSSEVWAAFRVARRARIAQLTIDAKNGGAKVIASHDGYNRLGDAMHRREWEIDGRKVAVRDAVSGEFENAVARFHLAPGVKPTIGTESGGGASGTLLVEGEPAVRWQTLAPAAIVPSEWHPEFGRTIETECIAVSVPRGRATETVLAW